jgi:hypothetical protein
VTRPSQPGRVLTQWVRVIHSLVPVRLEPLKVRKGYRDGVCIGKHDSERTDRGSSNKCGVSVQHLGISEDELFWVGMLVRVSGDSVEVEVRGDWKYVVSELDKSRESVTSPSDLWVLLVL